MKKQSIAISLILCLVMIFTSCSKGSFQETDTTEPQTAEASPVIEVDKSIAANDTDIGLNNQDNRILDENLSEDERLFLRYFSTGDTLGVNATDLQRYPDILTGSRICMELTVEKIIDSDGVAYQILGSEGCKKNEEYYAAEFGNGEAEDAAPILINGVFQNYHMIPGDHILVSGVFNGMKSQTVDGVSYYAPDISVMSYTLYSWCGSGLCEITEAVYTSDEMRSIIKTAFGDDVNIRKYNPETDGYMEAFGYDGVGLDHFYIAEIENKNDINFDSFGFNDLSAGVLDLNSTHNVAKYFTLTADMQHFLLMEINKDMSTCKLSYYDTDRNKLWSREFSETVLEYSTAMDNEIPFDSTENHIYIVLNQKLYILNTSDGEDAVTPKIVGKRSNVEKVADGLLLLNRTDESDGIVKTDLEGNVLWTQNISVDAIQLVGENYIMETWDYEHVGYRYLTLSPDGEILQDSSINR